MKSFFIFFVLLLGVSTFVRSQEIIPFPDLSENHIAVYNQAIMIENSDYSLYTEDYQNALKNIDLEIEAVNVKINDEPNKDKRTSLQSGKAMLIKKRSALLQEADLLEDLNKFY